MESIKPGLSLPEVLEKAFQYYQLGQLEAAEQLYREVLAQEPQNPNALSNIGLILMELEQFEEALQYSQKAVAVDPTCYQALNNIGLVLKEQKQYEEALNAFQKALTLKPDTPEILNNIGLVFLVQGKFREALQYCQNALAIKPEYPAALNNSGIALMRVGHSEEALCAFQKALALKPHDPNTLNSLGILLMEQGQLEEARCTLKKALEIKPDDLNTLNSLGQVFKEQGRIEEAMACFEQALSVNPNYEMAYHNWVYDQQFLPESTLKTIQHTHQRWGSLQTEVEYSHHERFPHNRLVLGFVSSHFKDHPVAFYTLRVIENLAQYCDIVCYANQYEWDNYTSRFQKAATQWHEVYGWSDQQLTHRIWEDKIDILFDLTGHLNGSRLNVFRQKPAPVQITWAGYMATTGVKTMDYLIADPYEIPEGAEQYYTEQVMRMPHCFICYEPPSDAPLVNALPAFSNQGFTFGSFNILSKITPAVVETWCEILNRLPTANLILKTRGLACPTTRQRYLKLFEHHGVSASRITCYPYSGRSELWPVYQQVDIQLDPFPFSGSTTTLESLWMGVPVITIPGETFASRHAFSYLSNIGLTDFIADDRAHYINLAVDWSSRLPELSAIRQNLRSQLQHSALCDAPRFAQDLRNALHQAWQRWCENQDIP
jgi:protein O-GlcNAc transferase